MKNLEIVQVDRKMCPMEEEYVLSECENAPPEQLLQGIEEFNDGRWFDCHETLEDLWAGRQELVRDLYQGILQVAVALHHWREGNFRGAVHLFGSAVRLLNHVDAVCQGVDVAALIRDTEQVREALENLGEERMKELDPELIPRVRLR